MATYIFISLGIIMMVYALPLNKKLTGLIKDDNHRRSFVVLFGLVLFFLAGYVFYLSTLFLTGANVQGIGTVLISMILFFGAVFVVLVLDVIYKLVKKTNEINEELYIINRALNKRTNELRTYESELENTKNELMNRNSELEETLEDFYSLRMTMEKGIQAEVIKDENKKIKKRLNEIKTKNNTN